jgi:hypothetical protein
MLYACDDPRGCCLPNPALLPYCPGEYSEYRPLCQAGQGEKHKCGNSNGTLCPIYKSRARTPGCGTSDWGRLSRACNGRPGGVSLSRWSFSAGVLRNLENVDGGRQLKQSNKETISRSEKEIKQLNSTQPPLPSVDVRMEHDTNVGGAKRFESEVGGTCMAQYGVSWSISICIECTLLKCSSCIFRHLSPVS